VACSDQERAALSGADGEKADPGWSRRLLTAGKEAEDAIRHGAPEKSTAIPVSPAANRVRVARFAHVSAPSASL